MKKLLAIFSILVCICVSMTLLVACNNNTPPTTEKQTYTITATNGTNYTIQAPEQAKEGETVTLTVKATDAITNIESVKANDTLCTVGTNSKYTFVMPSANVTVTVTTGYVQTEVLTDDVLSWRSNTPSQIAKAQQGDESWARQIVYFDFAEYRNVKNGGEVVVTSLNPDIIPQEALSTPYLHTVDTANGFCDYGSFEIALGKVSTGTAYIALHAVSGTTPSIDATIIKKIEVVNYGEVEVTTWEETVTIDLSNIFDDYQNINISISDSDYQYGTTSNTVNIVADKATVAVPIKYVVGHAYNVTVYIENSGSGSNIQFFDLNEVVTANASYVDGMLTFTLIGQNITLTVQPL